MRLYKGKIKIKGLGHAVIVSAYASNPSSAKKIIENQYEVKFWFKQMSRG